VVREGQQGLKEQPGHKGQLALPASRATKATLGLLDSALLAWS
jgi:hypothetical protein